MPQDAPAPYQVRLAWGEQGLRRAGPSDLVVVVDVFGETEAALEAVENTRTARVLAGGLGDAATATGAEVAYAGVRNAAAAARWVLARQEARGQRTSVSIVAAGVDGYAVQDHLGAGAVIAALGDLGIDHCSPEAAVAGEAFRALRGALRHLFTASEAGRRRVSAGDRDAVLHAAARDAASLVPVLHDGFIAPA
jgi:2-phosphosulfolactate phosphatase